jgi:hypothetical protein
VAESRQEWKVGSGEHECKVRNGKLETGFAKKKLAQFSTPFCQQLPVLGI